MTVVGSVEYEILAHLEQAKIQSEIDRQLNPIAARAGDRFGTILGRAIGRPLAVLTGNAGQVAGHEAGRRAGIGFGTAFRAVLSGAAVLGVLHAAFRQAREGLDEFSAGEKGFAQLDAALRSTNSVAGITVQQLEELAATLQKKTGVDDDAVVHAEGLLLTFTNVRNVAGEMNDVFTRGIKDARDLSVRGFGDLDSTSVQLGKALQDPIRGVLALSRAGVTFTAGQKHTIEDLVRANDLLGAQKLVLAEVEKQVGGSAEAFGRTFPGALAITRERFANLRGEIVERMVPGLLSGLGVTNHLMDSIEAHPEMIDRVFRRVGAFLRDFGLGVHDLFSNIQDALDANRDHIERITRVFQNLSHETGEGGPLQSGFGLLGTLLGGFAGVVLTVADAFLTMASEVGIDLGRALIWIGQFVENAVHAFDRVLNAAGWLALAFGQPGVKIGIDKARSEINEGLGGMADDIQHAGEVFYQGGINLGNALAGGIAHGLLAQAERDPALKSALDTLLGGPVGVGLNNSELDKWLDDAHGKGLRLKDSLVNGFTSGQAADATGLIDDYDKLLAEAQKKAADRARELGEAVTDGMKRHIEGVQNELKVLTFQRDKILDFRSEVLRAAGSFTQLSSLLDDPSTATAGRIQHAIENRLLGLKTFVENLRILRERHLDKGVQAELAQGGPQQRALAAALAHGTDAQLRAIGVAETAARQQDQIIAQQATDAQFGAGAIAKYNRLVAETNRQLALANKQLAAQPALIAKAVEAAQKNAKVTTKTAARTAVP